MTQLTASELAENLGLSRGRISQYVAEGKLEGCFRGDGRARRFDLVKVTEALGRKLDKGQMTGNGLGTRRVLRQIAAEVPHDTTPAQAASPRKDSELQKGDPDRLELAKIATAEENLRKMRRENEAAEGRFILADEAGRQIARALAREVAEFEAVLRDGARAIADKLGVDFKAARKILIDQWRSHRHRRAEALDTEAETAGLTEAEQAADI